MLELDIASDGMEVVTPGRIEPMSSEQGPHVRAPPQTDRLEVSDDLASPDDGEVLPTVLDGIEEIGEVAGCVSGADFWHVIRLSDY